MQRLAAVIFTAAVLASASAYAQRGFPVAPREEGQAPPVAEVRLAPPRAPVEVVIPNSETWTEPSGKFSFTKPRSWKDIDTASLPGAARLEMVAGDRTAECWFIRNASERTAKLPVAELIATRLKPIGEEVWVRLSQNQQLLLGSTAISVISSDVVMVGRWPVQVASLQGRGNPIYAALHARPGAYIWAFCTAKDSEDRSFTLNAVARSITTAQDAAWIAQLPR